MANQENQKIIPWQIGQIFYRYRKKLGWTQEQVANILGIERSAYSYYESGKAMPKMDCFLQLIVLYDIPRKELMETLRGTEQGRRVGLL